MTRADMTHATELKLAHSLMMYVESLMIPLLPLAPFPFLDIQPSDLTCQASRPPFPGYRNIWKGLVASGCQLEQLTGCSETHWSTPWLISSSFSQSWTRIGTRISADHTYAHITIYTIYTYQVNFLPRQISPLILSSTWSSYSRLLVPCLVKAAPQLPCQIHSLHWHFCLQHSQSNFRRRYIWVLRSSRWVCIVAVWALWSLAEPVTFHRHLHGIG